jgi:hypothetical protein
MPKYLIERDIPGIGAKSPRDLQAISLKSCQVLENLPPDIQWQHSFVLEDKLFCVYVSPNEELIREHAKKGAFPLSAIYEVNAIIDPAAAEGQLYCKHG